MIHIVKRNPLALVLHTRHAPTPYSLTVSMKPEINWTLCFDAEKDLMGWMCALTDVNIRQSLSINLQLTQKNGSYQYFSDVFIQYHNNAISLLIT